MSAKRYASIEYTLLLHKYIHLIAWFMCKTFMQNFQLAQSNVQSSGDSTHILKMMPFIYQYILSDTLLALIIVKVYFPKKGLVVRKVFPCHDVTCTMPQVGDLHGCTSLLNTLRPRQDGRHFADDRFKCIFLNENVSVSIKISLKFDPNGPYNNIPALVQIMAWRRPGDKPLSEPMMVLRRIYASLGLNELNRFRLVM